MKEVLNPKVALAFVGVIIGAVLMFVGTEDEPGGLHRTVQTLNEDGAVSGSRSQQEYPSELADESLPDELEDEVDAERDDDAVAEWASNENPVDRAEDSDTKQETRIGTYKPVQQRRPTLRSETAPQDAPSALSEEAKAEIRARFGE